MTQNDNYKSDSQVKALSKLMYFTSSVSPVQVSDDCDHQWLDLAPEYPVHLESSSH